jgi:hypothetical protein
MRFLDAKTASRNDNPGLDQTRTGLQATELYRNIEDSSIPYDLPTFAWYDQAESKAGNMRLPGLARIFSKGGDSPIANHQFLISNFQPQIQGEDRMKLNTVFAVWAIIVALFGLGFFFVPEMVLAGYGEIPSPAHVAMARLYGGASLALAVLAWLTRSITDSVARRKILTAILVYALTNLAVFLKGTLIDGNNKPSAWFNVILVAVFVCIYGYFYFTKRD